MVLWSDIDTASIEMISIKDKTKFRYQGGPLRFQVPRGMCMWGISAYKSFNIDIRNSDFIEWWAALERQLCPGTPFKSNMGPYGLRLKVDEATYIFDESSIQVNPEVREGLFRGQELSCLIDIEGTYFFNENWGLTCRAYQVRFYECADDEVAEPESSLMKGTCAFLPV